MDIVDRIGRYFAQHEENMSNVMQQALARNRDMDEPSTDETSTKPTSIGRTYMYRQLNPSQQRSSPSIRNLSPRVQDIPSKFVALASVTKVLKPPKRKTSRKQAKAQPNSPRPSNEPTPPTRKPSFTNFADAWKVACERAKKIHLDNENQQRSAQEQEEKERVKREQQLQKLEMIRRQAFSKPQPPPPKPTKDNYSDAWSLPRQRKPRPYIPPPRTKRKIHKPEEHTSIQHSSNQTNSNINPMTKFGPTPPAPSTTPYLDALEKEMRSEILKNSEKRRDIREEYEKNAWIEKKEAEQERNDQSRKATNAALQQRIQQLQNEKLALEESLLKIQNDETEVREDLYRLTMEHRLARRMIASSKRSDIPKAQHLEKWTQEELHRAEKAKHARELAKKRVQRRGSEPEIHEDEEQVDNNEQNGQRWCVSPLNRDRFEAAFYTYSSSSDDNS